MTFKIICTAISSAASADGRSPSATWGGPSTYRCGRALVRVNHSRLRGNADLRATQGIYGQSGSPSSPSAGLQRSLENRLLQRMGATGSLEYVLTWKRWDMRLGPPICALRARARKPKDGYPTKITPLNGGRSSSGHRTFDSAYTGWPTPQARDWRSGQAKRFTAPARSNDLNDAVQLVGWPTPQAHDARGPKTPEQIAVMRARGHGVSNLNEAARLAGWPSSKANNHTGPGARGGGTLENTPVNGLLGRQVRLSTAPTEKRGALNPDHSRFLMRFPTVWGRYAGTGTPSTRK